MPKIAGEIRRFLRDDGAVKVSRSIKEQAGKLYTVRERLRAALGREPTVSELAEETGMEIEEIASIETATAQVASLQAETGEGLTLESALGDTGMEESLVEQIALRDASPAAGAGADGDYSALLPGLYPGADCPGGGGQPGADQPHRAEGGPAPAGEAGVVRPPCGNNWILI